MPGKIFIAEPHPVHRESYAFLIDRQDDLAVCGVVASMDDAERALNAMTPDLMVVNLAAHSIDAGLNRLRALHRTVPDVPLLVVSACASTSCSEAARNAGAAAYLTRDRVPFDLISCIRQTLNGSIQAPQLLSPAA